jgi:hypothetical protein
MSETLPNSNQAHPLLSTVLRLFWMLAGNAMLFALGIAVRGEAAPGIFDVAFWALVAAMIGARWVDVALLHGDRTDGQPATMKDFGIYVLMLVGIAAVGYAIAFFTRGG